MASCSWEQFRIFGEGFAKTFVSCFFVWFTQTLLDYRALYCPAPSSPLLAIYGMIDGGEVSKLEECFLCKIHFFEVVGQSVLRLYRMEKGLPLVRSLMPEIPEVHFHNVAFIFEKKPSIDTLLFL